MKAVVMAGGEGSRLRPLTIGRPKPLVPLVNRVVMEHILYLLRTHQVTEVVATVQYMAEAVQAHFGDGRGFGVNLQYSVEESPLGTAGSVKNAEQLLDDTFIVISGDALTDFDLTAAVAFHREHQALATVMLARVPNPLEYGVVITEPDGRIRQFLEKPSWGEVFSDTVNTGIYILEPRIFDFLEPGQPVDFSHDLFPLLLARGEALFGYVASGYWCDVGSLPEYMRASADLLSGQVKLEPLGRHIGGGIWLEDEAEIAPDAQLYGPIYLGSGVQIKGGVVIYGPSVIRDFVVVDSRATIDRSIIWRNTYIGERAEVRGAVIGRSCSAKARAMVFEGAVVGDDTIVGDGAVIQPNIKIWPRKEIESGATVASSLIWGSHGRRVLFGRHGITGVVNVDMTPEFAAKLGAAYGAVLPRGTSVAVNREAHYTPRMIKRGIIAGLPSAGINVMDLRSVPVPVARYYTRVSGVVGGIHVRLSPFDSRVVDIKFFNRDGLDLDKATERKIENVFFREDYRRAYLDEIGRIDYAPNVVEGYSAAFLQQVDVEALQRQAKKFHLVVDYASANPSLVMPNLLRLIGCDVVTLNANIDDRRVVLTQEEFDQGMRRLAAITSSLEAAMGVRLDTGGERIYLIDDNGQAMGGMQTLAVVADLMMEAHQGGTVAVPVTAPGIFEKIAERYGGEIVRTRASMLALMEAAADSSVIMVGDGEGGFIFPQFHPGADGLFAMVKLMELIVLTGRGLSTVVEGLPRYATGHTKVPCRWEDKGRVMRILNDQYTSRDYQQVDGVKIPLGEEWVLILPDSDRPLIHVFAEAHSDDGARVLVERYADLVNGLQQ